MSACGIATVRADDDLAVLELGHLVDNVDSRVQKVEAATLESAQLAEAKAGERRCQHEDAVPRLDRVGEFVDLLDGRDGSLLRNLDAGALDRARVLGDQLVVDSSGEDAAKEPVALRGRRRARPPAPEEARVPGAHRGGPEIVQERRSERGQDVERRRPS